MTSSNNNTWALRRAFQTRLAKKLLQQAVSRSATKDSAQETQAQSAADKAAAKLMTKKLADMNAAERHAVYVTASLLHWDFQRKLLYPRADDPKEPQSVLSEYLVYDGILRELALVDVQLRPGWQAASAYIKAQIQARGRDDAAFLKRQVVPLLKQEVFVPGRNVNTLLKNAVALTQDGRKDSLRALEKQDSWLGWLGL